jgi:hypothetical protein
VADGEAREEPAFAFGYGEPDVGAEGLVSRGRDQAIWLEERIWFERSGGECSPSPFIAGRDISYREDPALHQQAGRSLNRS